MKIQILLLVFWSSVVGAQEAASPASTRSDFDPALFEWVTPALPPVPPGLPPLPPAEPVLRPKRSAVTPPSEKEKAAAKEREVLARKRALAPWLSDEELGARPALTHGRVASQRLASREFRKLALWPKLPAPRVASNLAAAKKGPSGSGGGGIEPNGGGEGGGGDTPNPKLHLIDFAYDPQFDRTEYLLWITDAPLEEWFTLFNAPMVSGAPWTPVHFGPPELGLGTSLQQYLVLRPGPPGDEGYFQCFLERDSDGDGLLDGLEVTVFKTDPDNPDSAFLVDRTGDGQPDYPGRGGNNLADGDEDLDGDGLSNLKELQNGTDPFVAQNNGIDSDADGLPDWAEELIFVYQGISNPGRRDDSDGDSVDNYTEVALGTDPSWPDAVFTFNFSNLPDAQRVVVFPPMTLNRASANPSVTTNHIFDTAGTLGTYLHVEVRRDRDADDLPAPGQDTLLFLGAYLTPISGYGMEMLMDGQSSGDAYIETGSLLATATTLFADIWEEANVSTAIDQLSLQSLYVLQQRAMLRTVIRMREMQLTIDLANPATGTQLRLRRVISEIHTEMTVFRQTSLRIAQIQGNNWATRAGFWVSGFGRVASIFSVISSYRGVSDAAVTYTTDVERRCDNYGDTATDLAVALGSMTSEFAPTFMVGNFWLIYWNQLNRFDGYDTPCF